MRSYNINLLGFNLPKKKNPSIIILPSTSFPLQSSSLLPAGAWTNDIKRSTEIGIRLWFWSTIVFISVCVCVCDQSLVISWLLDELYGGRLGGLYRRRETKKKKTAKRGQDRSRLLSPLLVGLVDDGWLVSIEERSLLEFSLVSSLHPWFLPLFTFFNPFFVFSAPYLRSSSPLLSLFFIALVFSLFDPPSSSFVYLCYTYISKLI